MREVDDDAHGKLVNDRRIDRCGGCKLYARKSAGCCARKSHRGFEKIAPFHGITRVFVRRFR